MINEKTWKDFRNTGLLWWINMILHTFGWAIILECIDDEIIRVYPARVGFRGFSEESNSKGFLKVSKYMKENSTELLKEAEA